MAQITSRPIQTESGTSTAARRISGRTIAKYIVLSVSGIFFYRVASDFAFAERGYTAIGGEAVFILLPLFCYLFSALARDMRRDIKNFKEEFKNETSL